MPGLLWLWHPAPPTEHATILFQVAISEFRIRTDGAKKSNKHFALILSKKIKIGQTNVFWQAGASTGFNILWSIAGMGTVWCGLGRPRGIYEDGQSGHV